MPEPQQTDWMTEAEAVGMLRSAAEADGVTRSHAELLAMLQLLVERYGVQNDPAGPRTRIGRDSLRAAIAKAQGGLQVRPGGPIRS